MTHYLQVCWLIGLCAEVYSTEACRLSEGVEVLPQAATRLDFRKESRSCRALSCQRVLSPHLSLVDSQSLSLGDKWSLSCSHRLSLSHNLHTSLVDKRSLVDVQSLVNARSPLSTRGLLFTRVRSLSLSLSLVNPLSRGVLESYDYSFNRVQWWL